MFQHLFVNFPVKCYELIIIIKTVCYYSLKEIIEGYNIINHLYIFVRYHLPETLFPGHPNQPKLPLIRLRIFYTQASELFDVVR